MTDTEKERQTHADVLIVALLCQPDNQYPGPNAWLCRQAWTAYALGQPFDAEAVINTDMDWLNKPEHADRRAALVGCCEHLRTIAAKQPLWDLPDDPFDINDWFTPCTCSAPDYQDEKCAHHGREAQR